MVIQTPAEVDYSFGSKRRDGGGVTMFAVGQRTFITLHLKGNNIREKYCIYIH